MISRPGDCRAALGLSRMYARLLAVGLTLLLLAGQASAQGADAGQYRSAGGLAVYIGLMPASLVKGHASAQAERRMHGGARGGRHEYHLVAAVFDEGSGARISDARVSARIAGLGLAGGWTRLEPMQIAGTTTYGAFVTFRGADRYTIHLEIDRGGSGSPVRMRFPFEHGRR